MGIRASIICCRLSMSTSTRLRVYIQVKDVPRSDLAQYRPTVQEPVPIPGREEESRYALNQLWYVPIRTGTAQDNPNIVSIDASQVKRLGPIAKDDVFGVLLTEKRASKDKPKCKNFIRQIGSRNLTQASTVISSVDVPDIGARIFRIIQELRAACFGTGSVLVIPSPSGKNNSYYVTASNDVDRPTPSRIPPALIAARETQEKLMRAKRALKLQSGLRAQAERVAVSARLRRIALAIEGIRSRVWSVPDIERDEFWQTTTSGAEVPLEVSLLLGVSLRKYGPGSDQQIELLKTGCLDKAKALDKKLTDFLGIQARNMNKRYQDAPTAMNVPITLFQDLVLPRVTR